MSKLKESLSRMPAESFEILEDHEIVNRRFPGDFYSWWRRSTNEVREYKRVLDLIETDKAAIAPLVDTLIAKHINAINFAEIVVLLSFSEEDADSVISEANSNSLINDRLPEAPYIGTNGWHEALVTVLDSDDIVPVVLLRHLIMKLDKKPSIRRIVYSLIHNSADITEEEKTDLFGVIKQYGSRNSRVAERSSRLQTQKG